MKRLINWWRRRPAVDEVGAEVTIGGQIFRITETNVVPDATGAVVQLGCERPGWERRRTSRASSPDDPSWTTPEDTELTWWREGER